MATSKPRARKVAPVPTSAMEAYKALQKSLQIRAVSEDEDDTTTAEEIDFLHSNQAPLLSASVKFAMTEISLAERLGCVSKVAGKRYFAFERRTASETFLSRPVNEDLFSDDLVPVLALFETLENAQTHEELNASLSAWDSNLLQKTLYSMAMSFCCAIDIQKTGDKKTPGTFFEYFVAYLISRRLRVNPVRRVEISSRGINISLPTDFIFEPGHRLRNLHVPVKTSTRERVIQVWAHQRVIDGTLGQGRYLGTPVILTETKLDKKKMEVVEICLPEQWQIYQGHISQLSRIYYLDLPQPYMDLNTKLPPISVKPFAEFFFESDALVGV
ncbi:hypothetical protein NHH73_23570 [Oxalobacteraceae bacterium OTU3CINTB1]|nr:hypothetical protein NHH73_23570 [Oxalobacteraceae bacterium OTU3CINTB1]